MKLPRIVAALIFLTMASTAALAKELVVFSAGAVKPALSALVTAWEARSGQRLNITYAAAGDLRKNSRRASARTS